MPTPPDWQLRDRALVLDVSRIMGVVNVTPDSFSDGGQFFDPKRAVEHALQLADQGADLLDVGGESTRPGASPVPLEEELRRVVPVVEQLAARLALPISIDTYKSEVARQALSAGAAIVNDITALAHDPQMIDVAARYQAGVVCMHIPGTLETMHQRPRYDDVVEDVAGWLARRVAELQQRGIAPQRIAVDPGIGFGKRSADNLAMLRRIDRFVVLGRPVCLGVSRKGFIEKVVGSRAPHERVFGTIGVVLSACRRGVQIVRVHDVRPVRDALALFRAVDDDSPRQSPPPADTPS